MLSDAVDQKFGILLLLEKTRRAVVQPLQETPRDKTQKRQAPPAERLIAAAFDAVERSLP